MKRHLARPDILIQDSTKAMPKIRKINPKYFTKWEPDREGVAPATTIASYEASSILYPWQASIKFFQKQEALGAQ